MGHEQGCPRLANPGPATSQLKTTRAPVRLVCRYISVGFVTTSSVFYGTFWHQSSALGLGSGSRDSGAGDDMPLMQAEAEAGTGPGSQRGTSGGSGSGSGSRRSRRGRTRQANTANQLNTSLLGDAGTEADATMLTPDNDEQLLQPTALSSDC